MQNRIIWLDIAKGIGIVSVFYGHCTYSLCNELFLYIYSYHMPLFFFISGVCFNRTRYSDKNSIRDFLHKRLNQLLIPLFASMVLFLSLNSLFGLGTYNMYSLCHLGFPPAMWFVFSLFIIEATYFFLNITFGKSRHFNIIIATTSLMLAFIVAYNNYILPASLSSVPIGMTFFSTGILAQKYLFLYHDGLIKNRYRYLYATLLLCVPLVYVLCFPTPIDLCRGFLPGSMILPVIIAFIGIAAILSVSILLEKINVNYINRLLCYLGRNTLTILMFHLFFINVSSEYLRPLLGGIGTEPLTVWIWLFIIIPIVNRYFPFLAGRGFAYKHY